MSFLFRHFPSASAVFNTNYRALRLYISNRSLKAWGAALSHFWKRMRGRPAPAFVTIAVTYKCQSRCEHCYSDSPTRPLEKELTTEELKSVIRQVRGLGAMAVHFSGGEPLLRKDIFDLVSYARSLGLQTRVNTNGILLNEENVIRLKAAGLTECGVSLDSADPAVHNKFRGIEDLHEQTIRGIRMLRKFGVSCRIMTVALKDSIPEGVEETIALGKRLDASYMYILLPIASGGWDGAYDQILNSRERAQIRALQDLSFAHLEMPTERTNCCVFRKSILYVSANGNVMPCAFVPFVIGNVKEKPLELLWQYHTANLNLVCRGDCPINIPAEREAMREHVSSVADELRSASSDDTYTPV
ncbi:MAG TPA: radical SAM protein [Candidatus Heimdallarchaeota archaeon]|nr:radical SAM protein [Candidatus Heimdallarchaeota archaeon]